MADLKTTVKTNRKYYAPYKKWIDVAVDRLMAEREHGGLFIGDVRAEEGTVFVQYAPCEDYSICYMHGFNTDGIEWREIEITK